jgi:hypothetical protein
MSRDKLIIFGVVILGLLGVLVYRQAKQDESLGAPMASSTDFPTISAADDVDKLEVTNGDKPTVVLERVPDPQASAASSDGGAATKWMVTQPVRADASQATVKDLLANLKDLKVESQVKLKLDDQVRKDKQLDAAHALHLVASKGGLKKVDETFGKMGVAGTLVVVADKPDLVWAAKGYSSYLYNKEAKDFRDKTIFKFDDANVVEVAITNTHGSLVFKKDGDKWTGSNGKHAIEHLDADKIKDMLRAYKALNADDFGDGKSLADTGLDKPEAVVTFHLKDDSKPLVLDVGRSAIGANRYAKRVDDETIVQVTQFVADWITSDVSKYQAASDAGAPAAGKRDAGKK